MRCSILIFLVCLGCQSKPLTVVQVISSDTVILNDGTKVRYAGLAAPEADHPWFEYTKNANAFLVFNKKVSLVKEQSLSTDDIVTAYVYTPILDGEKERQLFVNAELVKFGYARTLEMNENVEVKELWSNLRQIEELEAKPNKHGIWSGRKPPQENSDKEKENANP